MEYEYTTTHSRWRNNQSSGLLKANWLQRKQRQWSQLVQLHSAMEEMFDTQRPIPTLLVLRPSLILFPIFPITSFIFPKVLLHMFVDWCFEDSSYRVRHTHPIARPVVSECGLQVFLSSPFLSLVGIWVSFWRMQSYCRLTRMRDCSPAWCILIFVVGFYKKNAGHHLGTLGVPCSDTTVWASILLVVLTQNFDHLCKELQSLRSRICFSIVFMGQVCKFISHSLCTKAVTKEVRLKSVREDNALYRLANTLGW